MPFIIFIFAAFLFIYVELSLLVWVGSQLGIIMLILLLIGSSMLGIVLIRARGWFMLTNTRKQLAQGEIPLKHFLNPPYGSLPACCLLSRDLSLTF